MPPRPDARGDEQEQPRQPLPLRAIPGRAGKLSFTVDPDNALNKNKSAPAVTSSRNVLIAACIAIVLVFTGLRVFTAAHTAAISHDDAISYLAATGHETDFFYDQAGLVGRWLPASQLKAYTSVGERWDFKQIKNDLVEHDVHPPLYFWLLHVWVVLVGVSAAAGPLLNCLIFPLTVVLVYQFVRRSTGGRVPAAMACALLAASPVALDITTATRQYELLMLFSAAIYFLGYRIATKTRPSPLDYALLTLTAFAGELTHYYFVFPIASVFVLIAYRERRLSRRLLATTAALAAAVLMFLIAMPRFYIQFLNQHDRKAGFDWYVIPERIERIGQTMVDFLGWHQDWPFWPGVIVLLMLFAAYPAYLFTGRNRHTTAIERIAWHYLLFIAGIIFLLYSAEATSAHAMAPRYLASLVPLIAVVGALMLDRLRRRNAWLAAAIIGLFCANAAWVFIPQGAQPLAVPSDVAGARRIVIDSPARGVIFRDLINIGPDKQIYMAFRRNLVRYDTGWNERLRAGDIIILDDGYSNALFPRALLEWKIKAGHRMVKINANEWKILSTVSAQ